MDGIEKLIDSMKRVVKSELGSYDTTATVRRVEGDTAWVHIPGGVDETPVRLTMNAKEGDSVQVRVSDGKAFLAGNVSAPPTDDTTAEAAKSLANRAAEDAGRAKSAADIAESYATSAQASAAQSANILEGMEQAATAAGTTLDGIYADAAEAKATTDEINDYADTAGKTVTQILEDGETAGVAAQAASEAANSALVGLSTVEDVVGVLNWITEHGTMTLTSDVTVNPAHVYFIVDPAGDYVVGGTHYSIVSEPEDADIGTYYELSIDESVQNYVATHVAVDTEGLWLIPENNATPASSGKKILIATGAGSTYTTAGTYIIEKVGGVDTVLASFTASGAQIGLDNSTESYLSMDYHSLQLKDKENKVYFYVSDLRDHSGNAEVSQRFSGNGSTTSFTVQLDVVSVVYVKINNVATSSYTISGQIFTFTTAPAAGSVIEIKYITNSRFAKAYTLGIRSNNAIGAMSVAEGYETTASGFCSHSEGFFPTASGDYSHAEGLLSTASGNYAHAEGEISRATGSCSHAEGYKPTASGHYSHAEGFETTASGIGSHSEGENTTASGHYSHAEGQGTTASNYYAHAEGKNTYATGLYSHAQNNNTKASSDSQTAIGKYNSEDNLDKYSLIIGNGTADNARSNALTVDWSGNVEAAGDVTDGAGTSIAHLLEVQNTYGRLYGISSTLSLSTSAKKVPLNTFTLSSGCTLSSNGIKVPANGVYVIEGSAYAYTGFTVNDIIHILLYVNSSSRLESQKRIMSANPYETIVTGQLMISLSAGDVIYLYAYNQTGARGTIGDATSTKIVVHRIA